MITVELTQTELDLLITLLQSDDSNLVAEIAHTDARAFKIGLQVDRTELEALLAKLKERARVTSSA